MDSDKYDSLAKARAVRAANLAERKEAERKEAERPDKEQAQAATDPSGPMVQPGSTQGDLGELDPLEGITMRDCPIGCSVEHCAITHSNICGHPHKGGLQARFAHDQGCIERHRQARIRLARQKVQEM